MYSLEQLNEIEAIRKLRGRYQRGLDTKDWDLLRNKVLAEDATSEYADGKHSYNGREEIIAFLSDKNGLGNENILSMHHVHTPEIELTGNTTATGTWYLEDFVLHEYNAGSWAPNGWVMHGTAIYYDDYEKVNGEWKIKRLVYKRIFEDYQPRPEGSRLITRWNGKNNYPEND